MSARAETVAVLGASGQAGRAVVRRLLERTPLAVVATGRNAGRLAALGRHARLAARALDLGDEAALRRVCAEAAVVVNCVGPYLEHGARAARAALEAGAGYVDVASEQEHLRRLSPLDAAARRQGVALVTGAGLYPGLSGLLLATLRAKHPGERRGSLLLAVGRSSAEDVGAAALGSALLELSHPLETLVDGRLATTEPGASAHRLLPAPFGELALVDWPQLEILAAARAGGLADLSAHIAVAGLRPLPPWLLRALRGLAPERRPWLGRPLAGAARFLHRRAYQHPAARRIGTRALVRAELGRYRATLLVPDGAAATAWLPALLAARMVAGRVAPGVATAMEILAWDEVAAELRRDGERFELCCAA